MLAAILSTVVAIVLVVALGGGNEEPSNTEATAQVSATETPSQQPASSASQQDKKKPAKAQKKTPKRTSKDKGASLVKVRLVTKPKGAYVESGGHLLGKTPLSITFEGKNSQRLLLISKEGFESQRIVVESTEKSPLKLNLKKSTKGAKNGRAKRELSPTKAPVGKGLKLDTPTHGKAPTGMENMLNGLKKQADEMKDQAEKLMNPRIETPTKTRPRRPKKSKKPLMEMWD